MLSSDVSAGYDPLFASVYEPKNSCYLGKGIVFNKYTGSRGKSGMIAHQNILLGLEM